MIFYYTATGNSLFVARQLDKDIFSIPQELKKEVLEYKDEAIGIVSPIYAGELPQTVRRFIEKATFHTNYFYMILTYGKDDSVAGIWSETFCKQNDIHVDFIQTIKMVDNYLPSFDMEEEIIINQKINEQLKQVIINVKDRKKDIPLPTQEGRKLYEIVSKRFQEQPELNNGEMIVMSKSCEGCSICQQVCPIGNIIIENGRAKRLSKTCDFCLACVHSCPFQAIGLKKEKNPSARYRHPHITLKDIVKSNKQGE